MSLDSLDINLRIIWDFTIGIPYDKYDNSINEMKQNFKNAVYEITEEITKITDGVTYEYCYGTWNMEHGTWKENNIELNINHVQAMKTYGFARHFIIKAVPLDKGTEII